MEEAVAAPVGRLEPVAQVVPVPDRVHRLVADDLLEDVRRRRPVDVPEHQEAAVEPGAEQVGEVRVDPPKLRDACGGASGAPRASAPAPRCRPARGSAAGPAPAGAAPPRRAAPRPPRCRRPRGAALSIAASTAARSGPKRSASVRRKASRSSGPGRVEGGEQRPREGDARGFPAPRQEQVAEGREVRRRDRPRLFPAAEQRAAAVGQRVEQVAEEGGSALARGFGRLSHGHLLGIGTGRRGLPGAHPGSTTKSSQTTTGATTVTMAP